MSTATAPCSLELAKPEKTNDRSTRSSRSEELFFDATTDAVEPPESPLVGTPKVEEPDARLLDEPEQAPVEIDLARRATQVESVDEDCCSICLDNFTEEDPGMGTQCGHSYHLQCIMQWAQRSRECPMCFKALQLKDPDINELLPFGEYVPPAGSSRAGDGLHGSGSLVVGLEGWELERLLQRLALVQDGRQLSGHHRHSRRAHSRRRPALSTRAQTQLLGAASPAASRAAKVTLAATTEEQPAQRPADRMPSTQPSTSSSAEASLSRGASAAASEHGTADDDSAWSLPAGRSGASEVPSSSHIIITADNAALRALSLNRRPPSPNRGPLGGPATPPKSSLLSRCKESLSKTTLGLRKALFKGGSGPATPTAAAAADT